MATTGKELPVITATYHAPLGDIRLVADERGLTGLWFAGDQPDGLPDLLVDADQVELFREDIFDDEVALERIAGADAESGAPGPVFEDQRNAAAVGVLERTWGWLNSYFAGQAPLWLPPLHLESTELAHEVCAALLAVPYGEFVTFDELAERVGGRFTGQDVPAAAADAIDAVVRSLPIALIIPAHRVGCARSSIGQALRGFERASLRVR